MNTHLRSGSAYRLNSILSIIGACLIAIPLSSATKQGLARAYAKPSLDYLRAETPTDLSVEKLKSHLENLKHAHRLAPTNATNSAAIAKLHQVWLDNFLVSLDINELLQHSETATFFLRKSIELQPVSPEYWADLALELSRRGRSSSAEFGYALQNAARFSTSRQDVQQRVIRLGDDAGDTLSSNAREAVEKLIKRPPARQSVVLPVGVGLK